MAVMKTLKNPSCHTVRPIKREREREREREELINSKDSCCNIHRHSRLKHKS